MKYVVLVTVILAVAFGGVVLSRINSSGSNGPEHTVLVSDSSQPSGTSGIVAPLSGHESRLIAETDDVVIVSVGGVAILCLAVGFEVRRIRRSMVLTALRR